MRKLLLAAGMACLSLVLTAAECGGERVYWSALAYRMAEPVLKPMSEGKLHATMPVECSTSWGKGRTTDMAHLEAFGRLMMGIAPWLALPADDTPEGRQREQLRTWALKSAAHAVDPASPDYVLWRKEHQPLVDAAFLAVAFLRAYDALWVPLDATTKQRYIEEFQLLRRIKPPRNNWMLFAAAVETFLLKAGAEFDAERITSAVEQIDKWYVGDGWYSDGDHFAMDYYNSFVIQPMLCEVLATLVESKQTLMPNQAELLATARKRMQRYGAILERFVSPEGTYPIVGRSITYRTGVMQPLALLPLWGLLPDELPQGQARAALSAVVHRVFDGTDNFNDKGYLRIGVCGSQPMAADGYINTGSVYLAAFVFAPLGLPADHAFWTDPAQDWTSKKAFSGQPFPKDWAKQ